MRKHPRIPFGERKKNKKSVLKNIPKTKINVGTKKKLNNSIKFEVGINSKTKKEREVFLRFGGKRLINPSENKKKLKISKKKKQKKIKVKQFESK